MLIVSFARLYGVDVDWLYCGEGEMLPNKGRDLGLQAFTPEAHSLAATLDNIKDTTVRQRVFALCLLVMEHGDLPSAPAQTKRVKAAAAPLPSVHPKNAPIAKRQKRSE